MLVEEAHKKKNLGPGYSRPNVASGITDRLPQIGKKQNENS